MPALLISERKVSSDELADAVAAVATVTNA